MCFRLISTKQRIIHNLLQKGEKSKMAQILSALPLVAGSLLALFGVEFKGVICKKRTCCRAKWLQLTDSACTTTSFHRGTQQPLSKDNWTLDLD